MSKSTENIPGTLDNAAKVAALEQRRCILLAILSATPSNNDPLQKLLSLGLLTSLRPWLDDILNGTVGSVDLLLFFLSSIASLPVTKSQVRDSGMGKKVGSIEKHPICFGTLNENAIKSRLQIVKDSWNASVKTNKEPDTSSPQSLKRTLEMSSMNGINKKAKSDSFSTLLKKVSSSATAKSGPASSGPVKPGLDSQAPGTQSSTTALPKAKKQSNKRVKWEDHFGGKLEKTREIEGNRGEQPVNSNTSNEGIVSWSDRSKRDRLREKELFAEAKKKKLLDDDDFDIFAPAVMRPTITWRKPPKTPERSDVSKSPVDSKEVIVQLARIALTPAVAYNSENDVPSDPDQMSDMELALDMQTVQSIVPKIIPFFVPQEIPVVAPAPAPIAIPAMPAPAPATYVSQPFANAHYGNVYPPPPPPPPASIGATVEMVQAMGLPLFLVGSNVQALQTLAANPSLLNTFVDANGMYDQQNLMALVQTLGQSMPGIPQPSTVSYNTTYGQHGAGQQAYARTTATPYSSAPTAAASYGQQPSSHYGPAAASATAAYRGDKNTEANLHMAGYGPTTTQADIIALFAPYVRVKEVVMKNGFCFVNTQDPVGAQTAKENLNGAILGGTPIRINMAQRRDREATPPALYGRSTATTMPSLGVNSLAGLTPVVTPTLPSPPTAMAPIDVNSVRDDRGNPATKNLFVAGYGPATTESELRNIFGLHAIITGCVMKGNFAFVNTGDRLAAITARQALSGTVVHGGVLRINFAKETGRLGTSFDLTYNAASAASLPIQQRSYYGR
jgi:RNA recognition motif. (a.k.a. RRM, RBD, or RNP domain)